MALRLFDRQHAESLSHGLIDVTVPVAIATAAVAGAILAAAVFASSVHAAELVTIDSAAGSITVSARFAPKIVPFIADVVARGFKGKVHCYSWARSHRPNSLHHSGDACDFAQHWPKGGGHIVTHPVMYRVRDLTVKYGLRNGCSFSDCGHIDFGHVAFVARKQRLARSEAQP